MNDLGKIAEVVNQNNSIALVIHVNPDGDCIGSACALAVTLKHMGKNARVFSASPVPDRLKILDVEKYITVGTEPVDYDVCIAVDVASDYMMANSKQSVFDHARVTCCLDHHRTNTGYAMYNYVDSNSSAAGEIVYTFIKDYLCRPICDEAAKLLYAAIASDSGSFRYSNTTSDTLRIASELIDFDFDAPTLMHNLFEQKTKNQLMLNAEVISNLKFYNDGKICVACVDGKMLEKLGLGFEDADDISSLPRSVQGVEVGIYLKVKSENEIKASLRSNQYVDVSKIAAELGGGGHIKAAGVTLNMTLAQAEKTLVDRIVKEI